MVDHRPTLPRRQGRTRRRGPGPELPGRFDAGDEIWHAAPGERFRITVLGVGDHAVTLVLSSDWTKAPPSIPEWEALLELGQRIIDSVGF